MIPVANWFETLAEMRRVQNSADIANSQQVKGKVCAGRHSARPAYQPFGNCDKMGGQGHNPIAGYQQRKPGIDGLAAHSEQAADFSLVRHGACTTRTKRDQSIQKARVSRLA